MAGKERNELADGIGRKDGESAGNKIVAFLIALAIVVIWLGVFALLIKLDVGGVGSKVFYPVLKDIPVVNKILPSIGDDSLSSDSNYKFLSMDDAIIRIKELEAQLDSVTSVNTTNDQYIAELEAEITRLKTFEEEQNEFEKRKLEFDKEVVYAEKSPGLEE